MWPPGRYRYGRRDNIKIRFCLRTAKFKVDSNGSEWVKWHMCEINDDPIGSKKHGTHGLAERLLSPNIGSDL